MLHLRKMKHKRVKYINYNIGLTEIIILTVISQIRSFVFAFYVL